MANIGLGRPQEQHGPSTGPSRPQRQHSTWGVSVGPGRSIRAGPGQPKSWYAVAPNPKLSHHDTECSWKKHYRLDCLALESNFLLHKPVKVRQTPLSIPVILENMLYNPGWKWQCCPYQWFWRTGFSYCCPYQWFWRKCLNIFFTPVFGAAMYTICIPYSMQNHTHVHISVNTFKHHNIM